MIRSAVSPGGAAGWLASEAPKRAAAGQLPPALDALGPLRDVIAALRNLEHLLRSPRIGPRALGEVLPGLRELCALLSTSADEILGHFLGNSEQRAARELSEFLRQAQSRLDETLSWAARSGMDAKGRLAFEANISRLAAELTTARRLLEMVSRAAERAHTDLDLGEVVQESLAVSTRLDQARESVARVLVDLPYGVHAFRASAQVIVPLLTLGVAWVREALRRSLEDSGTCVIGQDRSDEPVSVALDDRDAQSVVIVISGERREGDVHIVHPPVLIPPVLACAEAAARMGGGVFLAEPARVSICWPKHLAV